MGLLRITSVALVSLLCVLAAAPDAGAQQMSSSGISGMARDPAGLPAVGVTVEAASDALIEKVRTVVTDGQGQYKIISLVPGVYTVTFRATGFATVRHEGIELVAGVTTSVNGDLRVGNPDEIVTFTAAVTQVDTENTRTQTLVSNETQAALPSGQKDAQMMVNVTPGMAGPADAGGSSGAYAGAAAVGSSTFHGQGGIKTLYDGMRTEDANGGAGPFPNSLLTGATVVEKSGGSAESVASGATINTIPTSGSNTLKFVAEGKFTNASLQSGNLDAALMARGLTSTNQINKLYDEGASVGGPLVQDKVWFIFAPRSWGDRDQIAGTYWNANQGAPGNLGYIYKADLSRPADRDEHINSVPVRITWQITAKSKINLLADYQNTCLCRTYASATNIVPPEATNGYTYNPSGLYQLTWTEPVTNKFLLEAGAGAALTYYPEFFQPGVTPSSISIVDTSNGLRYNSMQSYLGPNHDESRFNGRASAAYVTGSHAFKTGFYFDATDNVAQTHVNQNVNYQFTNGVPNQITEWATPYTALGRVKADVGIFAQDTWTLKRLTLNYGLRFDYLNGHVGAQYVPPTQFVPFARSYGDVVCVPCYKDISPRVGGVYDLFGTGKTALKASLGKYVVAGNFNIATANNPISTSVNSVTRVWNDTTSPSSSNYYVPNCDLTNPAANGDCGAINNTNFGLNNPKATTYAQDALDGWGLRNYSWNLTAEIQQQLAPRVSMTAGYYRNWYDNFLITQNQATPPSSYSPYCITAPMDSRLPSGGGYQECGFYDVAPSLFGASQNIVTQASHFGTETQINNFFAVNIQARLGDTGARLGGGLDGGTSEYNQCFTVDSPQELTYNYTTSTAPSVCKYTTPWSGNMQVKVNGSYPLPLPGAFTLSGIFQSLPGPMDLAYETVTNGQIAPSLGRSLAACGSKVGTACSATVLVPLITPGAQYEPRRYQTDVRVTKSLTVGPRLHIQGNVDVYNLFNSNAVTAINPTYGQQWLKPLSTLNGRSVQFSARLNF
jgi:hypothetical protein